MLKVAKKSKVVKSCNVRVVKRGHMWQNMVKSGQKWPKVSESAPSTISKYYYTVQHSITLYYTVL